MGNAKYPVRIRESPTNATVRFAREAKMALGPQMTASWNQGNHISQFNLKQTVLEQIFS